MVFIYLEVSQPDGTRFRLGLGCIVHQRLSSVVMLLWRLF
jgi:hypothetical protein